MSVAALTTEMPIRPSDVEQRLVSLINQTEVTARSHDQYLARRTLKTFLERISLGEVKSLSSNPRLAEIFYCAAVGLADAPDRIAAHRFAVIVTTVIPMRWRKGQREPDAVRYRADLA